MIWAYIFGRPGADHVADRLVIDREGQRTTLVPLPDEAAAAQVAVGLVDEDIELIDLCVGFTLQDAARVIDAVTGRVPVGHVSFGLESFTGAASDKAQTEAGTTGD